MSRLQSRRATIRNRKGGYLYAIKKLRLDYIRDGARYLYMALNEFKGARSDYGEQLHCRLAITTLEELLTSAEDYIKILKGVR